MLRRTAIAALAMLWTIAKAQQSRDTQAMGRWQGDARLLHAKLRARTGEIPTELDFAQDGAVSGRIGDATIPSALPKARTSSRVKYQVVLSGQVHKALNDELNHLIIIVTLKPGAELDADFHLKKRFGIDPDMLVGHFDVKRSH